MLTEEDFALFKQFKVRAMGDKLREIVEDASYDAMSFEEKMKILIDAEATARRDRKVAALIKDARFKIPEACIEDIIYLPDRSLTKDRVERRAQCRWAEECETMVVISKSGCGKSYLAQALGNAACRRLIPTRYTRLAWMLEDLNQARQNADGSYYEILDDFKSVQLLIIDDFMTTPISTQNAVDLFEIVEARENRRATLITSQLEPEEWYLRIAGELMADSILNRIATGSRYVDLEGPNMREYLVALKASEE